MDKTTKIIIVVAVLAVIGVIAWWVYSKKSTKTTESTADNTITTNKKESSTLQKIFDFGGDVAKDASESELFA